MLDITANKKLVLRRAKINEEYDIYDILIEAFEPYKKDFTLKGYKAAILNPDEFKKRIIENIFMVFVITLNKRIIGTVSILHKTDSFYIRSMAVHPDYQNKGIGFFILENISNFAKKEKIKKLSLESFKPLFKAVRFYEKYGFKKTGIIKDLCGNEIFEMIKEL